jgi:hypothetical protein
MYGQPPPYGGYGAPQPGFGMPPPGYGAPPPTYYPAPQPQQQGPMIINLQGNNSNNTAGSACRTCGQETGNIPRKAVGKVTILWCLCLLFVTGPLCVCYPFCTDSCKDTELVCVKCHQVKDKIQANCC